MIQARNGERRLAGAQMRLGEAGEIGWLSRLQLRGVCEIRDGAGVVAPRSEREAPTVERGGIRGRFANRDRRGGRCRGWPGSIQAKHRAAIVCKVELALAGRDE